MTTASTLHAGSAALATYAPAAPAAAGPRKPPVTSALAAIAVSNTGPVAASTGSAAGALPAAKEPSFFRKFLSSVVEDGMLRCRARWSKESLVTAVPVPHLPGWGFLGSRKEGLKRGLETAVQAIFRNHTRNEDQRRIIPQDAGDWALPLEAFPNQKLPSNTIALRQSEVIRVLELILPEALLETIRDYSQGFIVFSSSEQGSREYNEDRMFARPDLRTWGVFDGHAGSVTADQANGAFPGVFAEKLQETKGNVYLALQLATYCVALAVSENESGSVGAVAHFDEEFNPHLLTIGDCVIHIYRKIGGKTKCINVALMNDWSTETEVERAKKAGAIIEQTQPDFPLPCNLAVFPSEGKGSTNSRTLGDAPLQYFKKKPLVISKPAIAFYPFLQPDDIVLIMTDGYEFLPRARARIAELIDAGAPNLAEAITAEAAPQNESDNVTAIAIHICG